MSINFEKANVNHVNIIFGWLAGDDLSLKAPAKTVSETKSRVSASKPRPKIVRSK